MAMTFSDYDVKSLKFEAKTYGRKTTFRDVCGTVYIQ